MNTSFGGRLNRLIDEYIDERNQEIQRKNKIIEARNKELMHKWKLQIQHDTGKPMLEDKLKKYTRESLMAELSDKYHINLTRQKLNQYINDQHLPSKDVITAFYQFFGVTYEYLCGDSDISNPAVARIQDFIKLNDTAIHTLMDIKDDTMLTVLNALLSDSQSLGHVLLNMYEQAYVSYEQKHRPDRHGDYDVSAIHREMEYAISLNRFITDRLMPFVREDFDRRLREKLDYEEWRSNNWEEYERTKVPDMPQADSEAAVTVTILPKMLMYGKEASNRKQEIDRQHYTIPNQRPKDKHCGKI